jgi:hypothetical protein
MSCTISACLRRQMITVPNGEFNGEVMNDVGCDYQGD